MIGDIKNRVKSRWPLSDSDPEPPVEDPTECRCTIAVMTDNGYQCGHCHSHVDLNEVESVIVVAENVKVHIHRRRRTMGVFSFRGP